MFRLIERILGIALVAPPLYVAFRYLRWVFKRNEKEQEQEA